MPQTNKIGVYPGLDPLEDVPLEATHVAAYGDNVYVTSWDKKTGNWEVFLARSTDNGETFGDSVNLSNTTDKRSDAAHIYALEDNVYLTWWETSKNGTTVPVFRASNNNGETFGPGTKSSCQWYYWRRINFLLTLATIWTDHNNGLGR